MKRSKGAKIFAWVTIIMLLGISFLAYLAPATSNSETETSPQEATTQ